MPFLKCFRLHGDTLFHCKLPVRQMINLVPSAPILFHHRFDKVGIH